MAGQETGGTVLTASKFGGVVTHWVQTGSGSGIGVTLTANRWFFPASSTGWSGNTGQNNQRIGGGLSSGGGSFGGGQWSNTRDMSGYYGSHSSGGNWSESFLRRMENPLVQHMHQRQWDTWNATRDFFDRLLNPPNDNPYLVTGAPPTIPAFGKLKSINQLNQIVRKKQAPRGIERFDKGTGTRNFPMNEVHFRDGSSLYQSGVWRHHHGHRLTNEQIEFLLRHGWRIP